MGTHAMPAKVFFVDVPVLFLPFIVNHLRVHLQRPSRRPECLYALSFYPVTPTLTLHGVLQAPRPLTEHAHPQRSASERGAKSQTQGEQQRVYNAYHTHIL